MSTKLPASLLLLALGCAAPGQQAAPQAGHHSDHHPDHHADPHPAPDSPVHAGGHGHRFDDVARWGPVFESPDRAAWQKPDQLVAALALKPGQGVADIGAATGYFSRRFAAAVGPTGTVYATDIEPNMVAHLAKDSAARGLTQVVPVVARPDHPTLPPASVDLAFICDTIHHIEDIPAWLAALKPSLRPGARFVVVDFKKEETPMGPPLHMRLSEEELTAALAAAGWQPAGRALELPYQYALVFVPAP